MIPGFINEADINNDEIQYAPVINNDNISHDEINYAHQLPIHLFRTHLIKYFKVVQTTQ